jgi:adenylate cyclase
MAFMTKSLERLTLLLLGQRPVYNHTQAAEAAQVDLDRSLQLWQSLGLATPDPEEAMFTEADVHALRLAAQISDAGIGAAVELASARAWGQAMTRLAEWQVEMLRELADAEAAAHDPEDAQARVLDTAAELMPVLDQLQQYLWRRHRLAAADRVLTSSVADDTAGRSVVGFADVVGFTDLSRGLTEPALTEFIDAFETRVTSCVTRHHGRVIKTIGDEVMFIVDHPHHGAEIALELAELTSELDNRPYLHIGLAYGHVVHHLGDVYGDVVNLAARLTSLARPGTVLIDPEMAASLKTTHSYRLRGLRPVTLRGFPHLRSWLLRRSSTDPPARTAQQDHHSSPDRHPR